MTQNELEKIANAAFKGVKRAAYNLNRKACLLNQPLVTYQNGKIVNEVPTTETVEMLRQSIDQ